MWTIVSLAALALGLAVDAFAVAVAQGASGRAGAAHALRIGLAFGAAQGAMPFLGWLVGIAFLSLMRSVDHWVALILLGFLGVRMLREALAPEADRPRAALGGWALLSAAVATSIDALAAGVTLPALELPVLLACGVIGGTTFLLCTAGVRLGGVAGARLGKRAEVAGGLVLIALGVKIFVEHQYFGG